MWRKGEVMGECKFRDPHTIHIHTRPSHSTQNTSRAIAGMHLAQWNTVKDILNQQGLTPESPNLPISSLLPALKTGVAAAAKTVLLDGKFVWANATGAINALYASQVDSTQMTAINLGVAAGQAVTAMRVNDGSTATASPFRGKACHMASNYPKI